MRPTRQRALRIIAMLATIAAACALVPAAHALRLYEGQYGADLSASVPIALTPASGSTSAYPTTPLQLSWRIVPGASRYEVQVARQSDDATSCALSTSFHDGNIAASATVTGTTWVPRMTDAAQGSSIWTGRYCWRVRVSGSPPGRWSQPNLLTRTWSSTPSGLRFYNDHDGPIPRRVGDADYATGSTSTRSSGYVSWDRVAGAATYELEISTSQSFSPGSVWARRSGIVDSRVSLLRLPDDTYYWRVRAVAPNGTEGAWSSGANAFTVRWLDSSWSSSANIYPADSSVQGELRIGWTPMAGATYYEYQLGTGPGCFWNPAYPNLAPKAYGDWVNYAAIYDENDPPQLLSTADPQPNQCRLSDVQATTINNWVTLEQAIGTDAWENINTSCVDSSGAVQCEPAGIPDSSADDWGAAFHGASEGAGDSTDGRYGSAYDIYWRVRPVFDLRQAAESGWQIAGDTLVYGSWTRYTDGGANRHHTFMIDPSAATASATVDTRCASGGCLELIGSAMQATDTVGSVSSSSMQFPLLSWKPFAGADGYVIELARDPDFNNLADVVEIASGWQQSYAWVKSFADNSEGSGYWWRVVPCQRFTPAPGEAATACTPMYASASAGLPVAHAPSGTGYADDGVARTFTKQSSLQTRVVENFEGSAPLLQWTTSGVAASDHLGWNRGMAGVRHYEVELSRSPFITSPVQLTTSAPRIVPVQATDSSSGEVTQLADGLWYFRVRAVDKNDIKGAWSSVGSFNKRVPAPTVLSDGTGAGGAGATVTWSEVPGVTTYTFQYGVDPEFGSSRTLVTRQPAARIPNTVPGTYYWRVRSNVGGVSGLWTSTQGPVNVVAPTTISFAVNRSLVEFNGYVTLHGQLKVSGNPSNDQFIQLQRKNTGCESDQGSYVTVGQKVTGATADDGLVTFRIPVRANTCFRFAWLSEHTSIYSAPIPVRARPEVNLRLLNSSINRGKRFCTSFTSSAPITGRLRVQYFADGAWRTARSVNVTGVRRYQQCAGIYRSGRFPVRVVIDRQVASDWKRLEDVVVRAGTLRVLDLWRIDG